MVVARVLKLTVVGLLLSVGATGLRAGQAVSEQTLQVAPEVTLAGTLAPEAAQTLAASNALVVDLRGTSEGADSEARAMALAGVDYVHLPQTAQPPALGDVEFFRDLLAVNGDRPVVVHCRSGNRAALLWGAYRLDQGVALPEVLAEVGPIATSEVIRQAIVDYAQRPPQTD